MQQHISTYPDIVTYHCIAVTLGQAGYMKELFEVIDSMRSPPKKKFNSGILEKWDPRLQPDIVVYNAGNLWYSVLRRNVRDQDLGQYQAFSVSCMGIGVWLKGLACGGLQPRWGGFR
ncbi:hypothetical protein U1Q18_023108 [Sarracenia purpurea var. burkii]